MERIALFIVLYNREIREVPSWSLVANHADFFWFYLDNSVETVLRARNHGYCNGIPNVRHLDMGGNLGLSKAYNAGLACLRNENIPVDWVVMLDQDTGGLEPFLGSLSFLSSASSPICVPQVLSKESLLSPRYFSPELIRQTTEPVLPSSKPCAVNTGMAIRWSLLEELGGYDEEFFLDYVDYDFLLRAYAANPELSLGHLPSTLQQEFSGDTIGHGDLPRFRNYCRDLAIFGRKHGVPKHKIRALLFRRAAHLVRAHKSPRFLWEFLRNYALSHEAHN